MDPTRVERLVITKFRRFEDIRIAIGQNVTLIAGQNGTSKSTLLGMLAQPFSFGVVRGKKAHSKDDSVYTENYHDIVLSRLTDLSGRTFMYDCDDVFRLSKKHDKKDGTYRYETVLENIPAAPNTTLEDQTLVTEKGSRPGSNSIRFVTGPGSSHKSGEGNYPHPVIYLGLNRLWPLAQVKKCNFTGGALSQAERDWYVSKYNDILCLEEYDNDAQFMDTKEKKTFISPKSNDYDGESCSAGQDNLSQLLTAIISFRRLADELDSRYRGGLLLIDELDATLHTYAQRRLLALLCKESQELSLQVVGTTHSVQMLETALHSDLKSDTEVIYLANSDERIIQERFASLQDMRDHLAVESTPYKKKSADKVEIVLEDKIAQFMFRAICGTKLRNYVKIHELSTFGAGYLKQLAILSPKLSALRAVILLVDADMRNEWKQPPQNLLALPGDAPPEVLIYRHLCSLSDGDPFWKKAGSTYTKQVAIIRYGEPPSNEQDYIKWVKKWYRSQHGHWGNAHKVVFESWINHNKEVCKQFCTRFFKALRARYGKEIPKEVRDKVFKRFE